MGDMKAISLALTMYCTRATSYGLETCFSKFEKSLLFFYSLNLEEKKTKSPINKLFKR